LRAVKRHGIFLKSDPNRLYEGMGRAKVWDLFEEVLRS